MWIAMHPCGTWCAYKEKPLEKMSGWDGETYAVLLIQNYPMSWRTTLKEVSLYEYYARYRQKEIR